MQDVSKIPEQKVVWSNRGINLFLVAITVGIYWQTVRHGFIAYDDTTYIVDNPHIRHGLSFHSISWAFTTFYASNWHPLTWLSHLLDVQFYGLNPAGHHLTNVVLHAVTTVLLFALLRQVSGAVWRSAVVAALFACHPLHVESVAWVAERKDVLSALFWMLTLMAYVQYVKRPSVVRYSLMAVSLALGLMAKPMLVSLPLVLLLLDFWPLGRWAAGPHSSAVANQQQTCWYLVREKLPLFILVALSCVITSLAQRGAMATTETIPLVSRLGNAVVSYLQYLAKTVLPRNLSVFYPFDHGLPGWQAMGAGLFLVLITLVVIRQRRNRPYLMVGWGWYLVTLVPVIGIVQVGLQAYADRYSYIPLIGIFILAAWGVAEIFPEGGRRRYLGAVLATLILVACSIMAWRQVTCWRDGRTLFSHALEVDKNNFFAYFSLGVEHERAGKYAEAIPPYEKSIALAPWLGDAYVGLGNCLVKTGKPSLALAQFDKAITLAPDSPAARINRAALLASQGRTAEAMEGYGAALNVAPQSVLAHHNLAFLFQQQRRLDEAVFHYRKALEITPNVAMYHNNLGMVLADQGKFTEAVMQYREALRIDPLAADSHANMGLALQRMNKLADAVAEYRQAIALNPQSALFLSNLGAVFAEQGNLSGAIEQYTQALKIDAQSVTAHYNLAMALHATKQLAAAADHYRAALSLNPSLPEAHNNLGVVLAELGQAKIALQHFNQALRLRPDYDEARRNRDFARQ